MKPKIIVSSIILFIVLILILNSCFIISADSKIFRETGSSNQIKEADTATDNKSEIAETIPSEIETVLKNNISDQIRVIEPKPGQLIQSPVIVEGRARGTWFFEATFPVKLLDANRNVIASHYAQTHEEWMTEDFISFKAQIEFTRPSTATGIIVLEKNNPSDLNEYDAEIEIPIRFE
jgi:hypothetical protein